MSGANNPTTLPRWHGGCESNPRASATFLVEPYSIELENVQLNVGALRVIANATGGAFFRAGEIDSLPELIETPTIVRREKDLP
ncbi:MAG TPA: hypothetical protein ENN07_04225 [candidate division Zixibacteria bacterium]|nr:hypothetical protein [candidate division Zixibacteria bacterium]